MAEEISEQDLVFMWECPPSGISIFDNSGESSNAKSAMGPPETRFTDDEQKEKKTEGEALVKDKKGGRAGEDNKGKKSGGEGKGKLGESGHEIHIKTEKERRKKIRQLFGRLQELLPHLSPKADRAAVVDEAMSYIKMQEGKLQQLQQLKLERLRQSLSTFGYQAFPSNSADNLTNPNPYNSTEALIADHHAICNNLAADITNPNPHNSMEALHACQNGLPSNFAGAVTNPNPPLLGNLACGVSNPNAPSFSGPVGFEGTCSSPNVVLNLYGDSGTTSVCSPKKEGLLTAICFVLEKHKIEVLSAHISSDANRSLYVFHTHSKNASNLFPRAFPVEEICKQAATEINYAISALAGFSLVILRPIM